MSVEITFSIGITSEPVGDPIIVFDDIDPDILAVDVETALRPDFQELVRQALKERISVPKTIDYNLAKDLTVLSCKIS